MEEILNNAEQSMSSSVKAHLGILAELCGIYYDWKTKGIRSDQPSDVVLYVRRTCVRRKAQKFCTTKTVPGLVKDGETWDKVGTVPRFPGKGPFTQAIFVAATRCYFCRAY